MKGHDWKKLMALIILVIFLPSNPILSRDVQTVHSFSAPTKFSSRHRSRHSRHRLKSGSEFSDEVFHFLDRQPEGSFTSVDLPLNILNAYPTVKNAGNKAEINWQRRGLSPLPLQMGLIQAEYMRLQQMGRADEKDLHNMLQGIKLYQGHPFHRQNDHKDVVWQQGSVRLLSVADHDNAAQTVPLILIPSLINKADVLHITEEKSFQNFIIHCIII